MTKKNGKLLLAVRMCDIYHLKLNLISSCQVSNPLFSIKSSTCRIRKSYLVILWSDLNLFAAADKLKSVGDIFSESLNFEDSWEFPTIESIENPSFEDLEFVEFGKFCELTWLFWLLAVAACKAAAAATAAAAAALWGKVTDIINGSAAKVILNTNNLYNWSFTLSNAPFVGQ